MFSISIVGQDTFESAQWRTVNQYLVAGFRLGGSRQSQSRPAYHTKGLEIFKEFLGIKISNKNCYRCKVRRTPPTLTSILATRLCQATKSRDGTRSSETSHLLLDLQRVLRTQTFQGCWDFKNFRVLQHFHASEKEPSKVIKENFSKFVVKTFSEKKCLLHLWTVGKYQLTIADCKRSIRTFNVHAHTLLCVYEKLHNM